MPILAQLCRESSVNGAEGMRCRADSSTPCHKGGTGLTSLSFVELNPFFTTVDCPLDTHLHLDIKPVSMKYPAPTRNESTVIAAVFLGGSLWKLLYVGIKCIHDLRKFPEHWLENENSHYKKNHLIWFFWK